MPLPSQHTNQFAITKGKGYIRQISGIGAETGYRYLGAVQETTLSKKTETIEIKSAEGGLGTTLDKQVISADYSLKLTIADMSLDNLGLYLNGQNVKIEQTAQTDATEEIALSPKRLYQLGITEANPTGVRNVSNVTVSVVNGMNATTWGSEDPYLLNAFVKPTVANQHYYKCTVAGTSGTTEPTWPTNGTTVTDGTATWQDMGLIAIAATNYEVDATLGQLFMKDTFTAQTCEISYSAAASDFYRITSQSDQYYYEMMIVSDNPVGENRNWLFPRCTFEASGDLSLKSEKSEYQKIEMTVNVLQPTDGRNQVYYEGRPL